MKIKKLFISLSALSLFLFAASCGNKSNEASAKDPIDETSSVEENSVNKSPAAAVDSVADSANGKTTKGNSAIAEYKTTPSGLKYKVIRDGNGASPKATDLVTVHYEGKLTDGTVFDSSYQRGAPATFPLNGVIPGWTEGLQLMKEGSIYELYIPYQMAYGAAGAPPTIPPKADLIFIVELIKVGQ